MQQPPFIHLARIVKTHGLEGELSVKPLTAMPFDPPSGLHVWLVPPPDGPREGTLLGVRPGPKGPLIKISGIDDPATAHSVVGSIIVARPEDVPNHLAETPFDPIGFSVTDQERGALGTVADVIVTGANDVWVVAGGELGEILIPVIEDVVLEIDEEQRLALVRLLPGLLDEEDS